MLKKYVVVLAIGGLLTCGSAMPMQKNNAVANVILGKVRRDAITPKQALVELTKAGITANNISPEIKSSLTRLGVKFGAAPVEEKGGGGVRKKPRKSQKQLEAEKKAEEEEESEEEEEEEKISEEESEEEEEVTKEEEKVSPPPGIRYSAANMKNFDDYKALSAKGVGNHYVDALNAAYRVGISVKSAKLTQDVAGKIAQRIYNAVEAGYNPREIK